MEFQVCIKDSLFLELLAKDQGIFSVYSETPSNLNLQKNREFFDIEINFEIEDIHSWQYVVKKKMKDKMALTYIPLGCMRYDFPGKNMY